LFFYELQIYNIFLIN